MREVVRVSYRGHTAWPTMSNAKMTRSAAHVKGALWKYFDHATNNWRASNPALSPTLIHLILVARNDPDNEQGAQRQP